MERKAFPYDRKQTVCQHTGDSQRGLMNFLTHIKLYNFYRLLLTYRVTSACFVPFRLGKQTTHNMGLCLQWAVPCSEQIHKASRWKHKTPPALRGTGSRLQLASLRFWVKPKSSAGPQGSCECMATSKTSWKLCSCRKQILWTKTRAIIFENNFI